MGGGDADGRPNPISWTAPGSDDAFLALDRNFDGRIEDGRELFGSYTTQPPSEERNGFLALAMFDEEQFGGNGDGLITEDDAVFAFLTLWSDKNHDGLSQPSELSRPSELGVRAFHLEYVTSRAVDRFGNQFRYRSRVEFEGGLVRPAVDLFFLDR